MTKTIDFGNGIIIQRDGYEWWPPMWLHQLINKYRKWRDLPRKLRSKWRMIECEPTVIACNLVDSDAEHILLECISNELERDKQ